MPTILTKKSDTPGSIPATANLTNAAGGAELAVNTADKRLFTITSGSQVVELGTNPSSLTCADGSFTLLKAASASITNLTATSLVLSNLSIASANVTTLTSASATITNLLATTLTVSSGSTLNGGVVINEPGADVDTRIEGDTDANLFFADASTDRIGIGTASPVDKLTIYQSQDADTSARIYNDNAGASAEANLYITNSSADNAGFFAGVGGTGWTTVGGFLQDGAWLGSGSGASGGLSIMTRAAADMRFYTNGATNERMRITSAGNVGIANTSPGSYDADMRNLVVGTSGATGISIISGTSSNGTLAFGDGTGAATYRGYVQYNHTSDYLVFGTAAAERARITSGGIFSVNEASPSSDYRFYVNGASFAKAGFSSYTGDGVFGANARPSVIFTPASCRLIFGYQDGAGGQYNPAIGFRAGPVLGTGQVDYSNIIEATTNGAIAFGTGTGGTYTERARITSGGNVGINTTSPTRKLEVVDGSAQIRITDGTANTYWEFRSIFANTNQDLFIENNNGVAINCKADREVIIFGTTDNGAYNLQCNGTGVWGAGAYVNGSDARLKDNIQSLDSGLDVVKAMRPVTFQYKPEHSKDQSVQPGFIAQELQQAMAGKPYLDGVVQQGTEYLNVAYQNIIPILVKAIQELEAKVAELEAK